MPLGFVVYLNLKVICSLTHKTTCFFLNEISTEWKIISFTAKSQGTMQASLL